MYTIKLHDGREITNLTLNGTNYISKEKIDESIFTDNLKTMIVTDDEGIETTYQNVELVQQVEYSDGFYLCFHELSEDELDKKTTSDNITDIQLAIAELYESMQ